MCRNNDGVFWFTKTLVNLCERHDYLVFTVRCCGSQHWKLITAAHTHYCAKVSWIYDDANFNDTLINKNKRNAPDGILPGVFYYGAELLLTEHRTKATSHLQFCFVFNIFMYIQYVYCWRFNLFLTCTECGFQIHKGTWIQVLLCFCSFICCFMFTTLFFSLVLIFPLFFLICFKMWRSCKNKFISLNVVQMFKSVELEKCWQRF